MRKLLSPEQQEDILMQRSVMDEPRSMLQKVLDFAWGRTLPEQATSAFTGGLGQILIRKELENVAKQALSKMQPEVVDWMRRSPTKFVVEPVTREHVSSVLPKFSKATAYMQPGPGVYTARVTRPEAGMIGHELAHAAQYAIGKERRGIPGTRLEPWAVSYLRKLGYWPEALPEEFAADVLAGPERMQNFGARIWDQPQFMRYIKENYPQLSTPPVQEIINEVGDVIPRSGMPPFGTSPQWKLTKNAPPWLRRSFEGGKREVPLQEVAPRRAPIQSPGLVKKPVTYELPESADELAPLLEQLGGSYGKRKLPPVSGGAPTPFDKLSPEDLSSLTAGDILEFKSPKGGMTRGRIRDVNPYSKEVWIFPADRSLITDADAASITVSFTDITKILDRVRDRKLPPVSGGVDLPKKMSKKQFETFKMWAEKAEREADIPLQPPYQEVDAYLKPPVQPGLAPLLKKYPMKQKPPPVSGGAPSMFEKFTSKGLPVPRQIPPGKGTQDILGHLRETTEYPTKPMIADFFSDMGTPEKGKLLETIRKTGQRWNLTDEEVAAMVRRGEQMGTNALDALRPPPEPEQIRAWVRSVLGP